MIMAIICFPLNRRDQGTVVTCTYLVSFVCVKFVQMSHTQLSRKTEPPEIYFKIPANVLWELASVEFVGQTDKMATLNEELVPFCSRFPFLCRNFIFLLRILI